MYQTGLFFHWIFNILGYRAPGTKMVFKNSDAIQLNLLYCWFSLSLSSCKLPIQKTMVAKPLVIVCSLRTSNIHNFKYFWLNNTWSLKSCHMACVLDHNPCTTFATLYTPIIHFLEALRYTYAYSYIYLHVAVTNIFQFLGKLKSRHYTQTHNREIL